MKDCTGLHGLINGTKYPLSELSLLDFSDGKPVYEVLRIHQGIPLFLEDHLERIFASFSRSNRKPVCCRETIASQITQIIHLNFLKEGAIKIIFTNAPSVVLYPMQTHLPSPQEYITGVQTVIIRAERENPNAKIWREAFRDAVQKDLMEKNAFEGILMNGKGFVTEGTRSNVFFIRNNHVVTPPEKDILPGITRMKVLHILNLVRISYDVAPVHVTDLRSFQTAFISGTTRKVVPVKTLDGVSFDPSHPLLHIIIREFEKMVQDYVTSHKSAEQ